MRSGIRSCSYKLRGRRFSRDWAGLVSLPRLAIFSGIVLLVAALAPGFVTDRLLEPLASGDASRAYEPLAPAPDRQSMARQIALDAGPQGHFISTARINGQRVEIMVDTGASVVALNDQTARRLGISPPSSAYNLSLRTANGVVKSAPVTLSEIRLGDVTVRNVSGTVVPDDALSINLLGMSFLRRLSGFEVDNGELVLTQ